MVFKLILALDFSNEAQALTLIDQISPSECGLKVGSEMFTLLGSKFIHTLVRRDFKVFLDLKFHDIPTTVARACCACAELGVWMINVHAAGGIAMMQAARKAIDAYQENRPLLIAVTALTSMQSTDLAAIGYTSTVQDYVVTMARFAYQSQLDGVVCSALEVSRIKSIYGSSFLTITPGIRRVDEDCHDQVRVVSPSQAIQSGSDFLVIGRAITKAPDPLKAFHEIVSLTKLAN